MRFSMMKMMVRRRRRRRRYSLCEIVEKLPEGEETLKTRVHEASVAQVAESHQTSEATSITSLGVQTLVVSQAEQ